MVAGIFCFANGATCVTATEMAPFGYAMYNYDMNNNGAISLAQSSMQTTQGGTSTSTPNYGINSWGPGSPFGTNVGTGLVQLNRATVATLPQVGGLSIQNYGEVANCQRTHDCNRVLDG